MKHKNKFLIKLLLISLLIIFLNPSLYCFLCIIFESNNIAESEYINPFVISSTVTFLIYYKLALRLLEKECLNNSTADKESQENS